MKKIKNKLNNNHGVSILFGLLLFMVASMVSIVIISASSTSAKRSYYTSSSIQESQAVESLALFMKKEISNKEVSFTFKKDKNGNYIFDENAEHSKNDNFFDVQLKELATYLINDDLTNAKNINFKVSASNLDDVNVSVSNISKENDGSFFINFLLSSENKNMYVAFDVSLDSSETTKTTKVDIYKWEYKRSDIKEVSPNV